MAALPTSIEASLKEAGFSGTEILIMRHLLEEESMGLREIAAKTGKSTGVLDQALKKLMQKKIINKQDINGTPKYVLRSLSSISQWMERDMQEKREMLDRRFQNFESFIRNLEVDKKHPDMEYYDGANGLMQAYQKLLTYKVKEFLHYVPVLWSAEDDPLRDFRVQFFRERRKKGIFSRIIAHNTPLGRRFQSRDPFEYRETVLVDEKEHPFVFEKIIANGTVACFNLVEKRACFIHFPEFADAERLAFENLWKREYAKTHGIASADPATSSTLSPSLSTRTLSALREFFLSKKSLATFAAFAVVAAGITVGLYTRTSAMNFQRMKDRVQAIATTASFQFDPKDLDRLRKEEDWKRPEWAKVVNQLREIRQSNADIIFAYIVRKSPIDPTKGEFVADSHSINPYANTDDDPTNNINVGDDDGFFDPQGQELLQWPGQEYDPMPREAFEAYNGPTTNEDFYTDKWGTFITGYAPIKDRTGEPVAVVGIDIEASKLKKFNAETFKPLLYFFGFFIAFVLIRFMAFNRSLFQEIWMVMRSRRVRWTMPVVLVCIAAISLGIYYYLWTNAIRTVGLRMQSIAATAAKDFSELDLNSLRFAKDMKTETYQEAFRMLNDIRNRNPGVKFSYIYRPTNAQGLFEFVADADSNYFTSEHIETNFDGKTDDADENVWPGFIANDYEGAASLEKAFKLGIAGYDKGLSQWGPLISGYAPIFDKRGEIIGVLGVDFDLDELRLGK